MDSFYYFFSGVLITVLGLCVGSFLNMLNYRLPRNESLLGRSYCDHCKRQLPWYCLLPVLSYLCTQGKSACCKKPLPLEYFLVELATAVLFVLFFVKNHYLFDYSLLFYFVLIACVIAITVIDLRYLIIPDELLTVVFVSGLLMNYAYLPYLLGGALVGAFFLWCLYYFSQGKAMGFGDVKFVFVTGFVLPLPFVLLMLYGAFLTGGVISAILLVTKKRKLKSAVPFGPFLAFSFLIALWLAN